MLRAERLRRAPEWIALALYAVVLTLAIPFHEPWSDEAQAWQIARSLPLHQMFRVLSYEGSPGLWHLLLWGLNRVHVPYAGMSWFSGLLALAGAAILVFYSPFPRWLKLLLPFTYFLLFQYAVIARSYVLAPLLLFLLAALWSRRFEQPVAVVITLGLLANVALHLAMFSGGFAIVFAMEWWMRRRGKSSRLAWATALLLGFYAVAILTAKPAKDIAFPQGNSPLPAAQSRGLEQAAQLRHGHGLHAMAFRFSERLTPPLAVGLVLPLAVALLFWATLSWALWKEDKFRYLMPGALFVLFCHYVAVRPWQSGLVTPYVIAVVWMVWPDKDKEFGARARHEQAVLVFFFMIVLLQIRWALFALHFDHAHAYSPGRQTALFLQPYMERGTQILETGNHFDSVAVEPYFEGKIFTNEPYAFHWWSKRNMAEPDYLSMVRARPSLVLVQWSGDGDVQPAPEVIDLIPEVTELRGLGYLNTHSFCGEMPVEGAVVLETHCELVFEPGR